MTVRLARPGRRVHISVTRIGTRYRALPITSGGHFVAIESGPVDSLTDMSQQQFIDELNAWTKRDHLQLLTFVGVSAVVGTAVWIGVRLELCFALLAFGVVALAFARWAEFRRRRVFLEYSLDERAAERFATLCAALESLSRSGTLDSVRLEHIHGDWKRNAGATTTVHSDRAAINRGRPKYVRTDLGPEPLLLHAQGKKLWFLPDRLLVEEDGKKAAIAYDAMVVRCATNRMRWHGRVPHDAKVVDRSWQFVNKDGGPDRRFNNNHVVPIILMAELTLRTEAGLEIVLQASATKSAAELSAALVALADSQHEEHRLESVRLLRETPTWAGVDVRGFANTVARDFGSRTGNLKGGFVAAVLSDFRDLFLAFDDCTRRTALALDAVAGEDAAVTGKDAMTLVEELRRGVLQLFASAVASIERQLSALPTSDWLGLRAYISRLADQPGVITSFTPELLEYAAPGERSLRSVAVRVGMVSLTLLVSVGAGLQLWRSRDPSSLDPPAARQQAPVRASEADEVVRPARVTASSTQPAGPGYSFSPDNVADGNLATSWQPSGGRKPMWIRLDFESEIDLTSVSIANGFQSRDRFGDEFILNDRIAVGRIRLSDGVEVPVRFAADTRGLVRFPLSGSTTWIALFVDETHRGTKWHDLAVSEIEVRGHVRH